MLSKKTKDRLTIFHQARRDDIDRVLASYRNMDLRAYVKPFFEDVERLMSESQVIICRAGTSTFFIISEISVNFFGLAFTNNLLPVLSTVT